MKNLFIKTLVLLIFGLTVTTFNIFAQTENVAVLSPVGTNIDNDSEYKCELVIKSHIKRY